MKVILFDNIRGIGRVGDLKEVSDGYARNFLIPRGLAKAATDGAVKEVATVKAKKLASSTLARSEAEALSQRINGATVDMAAKANPKGTLFAGIEASAIAEALSAKAGVAIAPKQIHLPEPIKTVGDHPIVLKLADDITADVVVRVVAQ